MNYIKMNDMIIYCGKIFRHFEYSGTCRYWKNIDTGSTLMSGLDFIGDNGFLKIPDFFFLGREVAFYYTKDETPTIFKKGYIVSIFNDVDGTIKVNVEIKNSNNEIITKDIKSIVFFENDYSDYTILGFDDKIISIIEEIREYESSIEDEEED